MKLYEISLELQSILEAEEELDAEMESRLDQLQWELEKKVQGCLEYRQGLMREQEAIGCEVARLQSRASELEAKADRLQNYVQFQLERIGIGKVTTPTVTATICKAPPSVRIEGDVWKDTLRYCRTRTTVDPDKKAILEDFKAGVPLPAGVSVLQSTYLKVS